MLKGLIFRGKRERKIVIEEHTLFTKTQIAVLAYFAKNKNKPQTVMEIARAYVSSSYSNYKKACEELVKGGWLEKLTSEKYKVKSSRWENAKRGIIQIERKLPYFDSFLRKLTERGKDALEL